MKISIIIPMYNAEQSITDCLHSVINQDYEGELEILIINDGSVDNSGKIVDDIIGENKNNRISFKVFNQSNKGVSAARNIGLYNSTGKYIAMLDSDDEWLPNKLSRQIDILKTNPNIDFLGCGRNDEVLKILGKEITTLHKATVTQLFIKMFPQTSTAIFKRKLYEDFGGYNESMTHAEDGNLWIRYCASSSFYYLPESLVITGKGKPSFGFSGLSANLKAMQKGNEMTFDEARKNGSISFPFYCALYIFARLKYLRRIILTKNR